MSYAGFNPWWRTSTDTIEHNMEDLIKGIIKQQPAAGLFALVLLILALAACAQPVVEPETTPLPVEDDPKFEQARQNLAQHAVRVHNLEDKAVIDALATVPRHRFVSPALLERAYNDTPLPIGYGQTISQPSLVAWMTEILELEPGDRVLEIGTGSGYQAAILGEMGYVAVYSIEIVPELYERSRNILDELGYTDVRVKQGDGYFGWPEYAPYDAILVTAAPDHLPAPLAEQLAEGGVMVIPIGPPGWHQTLWRFVKVEGELTAFNKGSVSFVPFLGEGVEN